MTNIHSNKTYYVDMEIPTLKPHRSPLLTAVKLLRIISSCDSYPLCKAWNVFQEYIKYKCLGQSNHNCQYVLNTAEHFSRKVKEKLEATLSDEYIEAAVLLYTVLALRGLGAYIGLREVLLKAFESCIEYSRHIADISASPALSRCLGLSNIMIDQLSDLNKEFIESMNIKCLDNTAEKYANFCTYVYFAKTLRAFIAQDEVLIKELVKDVENWLKTYISLRYRWLPATALNMLTYGLISSISRKSNLDTRMCLLEKSLEELENVNAKYISKHVWIMLELALVINYLDVIQYVGRDCVVIPIIHLKELKRALKPLEVLISNRVILLELIIVIGSLASTLISYMVPFNPFFPATVLSASLIAMIMSLLFKKRQEYIKYCIEFLEKITAGYIK